MPRSADIPLMKMACRVAIYSYVLGVLVAVGVLCAGFFFDTSFWNSSIGKAIIASTSFLWSTGNRFALILGPAEPPAIYYFRVIRAVAENGLVYAFWATTIWVLLTSVSKLKSQGR